MNRRGFLIGSLAACAARTLPKPMAKSILVLGGSNFLGPHVVTPALARGHAVTLFNRGRTHPDWFPNVEKLRGDRDGHLEALAGRRWDAVVDTSGFVPRIVEASARLLAPNVGHYVFISSISVYAREDQIGADESAPLDQLHGPPDENVGVSGSRGRDYGALKALCEQTAERVMPGRVASIRPGLIVGPGDPTGRFSHWVSRMADGGEVLGPGDGTTPVQFVDGRDLGAWIVHVIETGAVGTYNALCPGIAMNTVLDACNTAAGGRATITWVDAKFLDQHGAQPWSELPLWVDNHNDYAGFGTRSSARAIAAGLTFRPVLETAKDTLGWLSTLPADDRARSSGLARDKEAQILAAWHAAH